MSDAAAMNGCGGFEALIESVLREQVEVTGPDGLEQRLLAKLAQEPALSRQPPFTFAQRVAAPRSSGATWFAVSAHAAVLLLVFFLAGRHMQLTAIKSVATVTQLTAPPPPIAAPKRVAIGGGGGRQDLAPATRGHLPKLASEQLLPPKAPATIPPKLAIEPSVIVQPDLKMASNTMPNIGMPSSSIKGYSMGDGVGTGVGSGNGAGIGPGAGGNTGGGVLHIGGAVLPPSVISQIEPEFSEEARKAKFSGNVEVYLWVDEQGKPSHIQVARGVGMGLDEKAVEAVRQYRFKPAMKNGKPVKVDLYIDVNFQIF